jgi:hypothetical protein
MHTFQAFHNGTRWSISKSLAAVLTNELVSSRVKEHRNLMYHVAPSYGDTHVPEVAAHELL